jgi:hypothetical protein
MRRAVDPARAAARLRRRLDRWPHKPCRRWYALALGYFWLPCAGCGLEFGGHEVDPMFEVVERVDPVDGGERTAGRMVCPACQLERRLLGAEVCSRHGHDPIMLAVTVTHGSVTLSQPTVPRCRTCGATGAAVESKAA